MVLGVAVLATAGCGGGHARGGPAAAARPAVAPTPLRVTVSGGGLVSQQATGIAVGGGRVLTVAHVLAGGGAVRVAGRRARVLRSDRRLDLALLAVRGLSGRGVRLGRGTGPAEVEVLRGGRSRALAAQVRRRVTATVKGPGSSAVRPALELSAAVRPGDSGAPVTDAAGRVLGIVFARSDDGPPTAWAVAASAVGALLSGRAG